MSRPEIVIGPRLREATTHSPRGAAQAAIQPWTSHTAATASTVVTPSGPAVAITWWWSAQQVTCRQGAVLVRCGPVRGGSFDPRGTIWPAPLPPCPPATSCTAASAPHCTSLGRLVDGARTCHSLSMTLDKQGGSPIRLRLDPSSGVPTYLQVVQQVERALRLGFLQPGDQLPKVREVVADLAINPNTVLKAYRELEHKGLASGRPGAGTSSRRPLRRSPCPSSPTSGARCVAGSTMPPPPGSTTEAWSRWSRARCGIFLTVPTGRNERPTAERRGRGRCSVNVIETHDLGRRYGATWALQECTLTIPAGHLTGLVGPNGAGKTTLLNLVMGLSRASAGSLTVLGDLRPGSLPALDGIGFVAQDVPVYRGFSVAADMVTLTKNLNRTFDVDHARRRLDDLGIELRKRAGQLSGGQRAQLALTLALARRPRLLVLDEPTAALDPLARHDFMAAVMAAMAEDGLSVVLSSHLLAELERVADHVVLMSAGRVCLDGPVDDLLAAHRLVTTRTGPVATDPRWDVVSPARRAPRPSSSSDSEHRIPAPPGLRCSPGRDRAARDGLPPHRGERFSTCPRRSPLMTTLARVPDPGTEVAAVPLRQLAWVAWRRNRATVLGLGGFLTVLASYLLFTGLRTHTAYDALGSCIPPITTDACRVRWDSF